ncbi:transposase, partial [Candidatus Sumerlaeota bacterium]|nr:transposase [Candidatus Sumerlaeota bacterium]
RGYDASGKGNEGIDPVVLFKMLILEQVYNLSDVQVSAEAGDRFSKRASPAIAAPSRPCRPARASLSSLGWAWASGLMSGAA